MARHGHGGWVGGSSPEARHNKSKAVLKIEIKKETAFVSLKAQFTPLYELFLLGLLCWALRLQWFSCTGFSFSVSWPDRYFTGMQVDAVTVTFISQNLLLRLFLGWGVLYHCTPSGLSLNETILLTNVSILVVSNRKRGFTSATLTSRATFQLIFNFF